MFIPPFAVLPDRRWRVCYWFPSLYEAEKKGIRQPKPAKSGAHLRQRPGLFATSAYVGSRSAPRSGPECRWRLARMRLDESGKVGSRPEPQMARNVLHGDIGFHQCGAGRVQYPLR